MEWVEKNVMGREETTEKSIGDLILPRIDFCHREPIHIGSNAACVGRVMRCQIDGPWVVRLVSYQVVRPCHRMQGAIKQTRQYG